MNPATIQHIALGYAVGFCTAWIIRSIELRQYGVAAVTAGLCAIGLIGSAVLQ